MKTENLDILGYFRILLGIEVTDCFISTFKDLIFCTRSVIPIDLCPDSFSYRNDRYGKRIICLEQLSAPHTLRQVADMLHWIIHTIHTVPRKAYLSDLRQIPNGAEKIFCYRFNLICLKFNKKIHIGRPAIQLWD